FEKAERGLAAWLGATQPFIQLLWQHPEIGREGGLRSARLCVTEHIDKQSTQSRASPARHVGCDKRIRLIKQLLNYGITQRQGFFLTAPFAAAALTRLDS